MTQRFYRYTIQGELSLSEAQAAVGEAASTGEVVRLDTGRGETHLWLTTPEAAEGQAASAAKPRARSRRVRVVEVDESDVIKLG